MHFKEIHTQKIDNESYVSPSIINYFIFFFQIYLYLYFLKRNQENHK